MRNEARSHFILFGSTASALVRARVVFEIASLDW